MIRIDRSRVAEPAVLGRKTRGKSETELAIEHFTHGWDGRSPFGFSRYKEDDVKAALDSLFHGKCAYCESFYGHVSPEDIEHFRPKGSVQLADGGEKKPGYYWLAATWSNLLPSCVDCNRKRRQVDERDPDHLQSGKESQFPVADETHRWIHHDQADRNGEQPLLLDPTSAEPGDDPRLYLEVVEKDGRAVMGEKPPSNTFENTRARASIDVFGLNRSKLVDQRSEHLRLLQGWIRRARNLVNLLLDPRVILPVELRDEQRMELEMTVRQIKAEREPKSPYLLMKLPLINGFMAEYGERLHQLGLI